MANSEIDKLLRKLGRTFLNMLTLIFFLRNLPLKDDLGGGGGRHRLRFGEKMPGRTPKSEYVNWASLASEEGRSGCKSQNIAIRALKGDVNCQIWFKWTYY